MAKYLLVFIDDDGAPAPLAMQTTSPLVGGTAGLFYSVTFTATGGTGGNAWTVTAGESALTAIGLTLSTAGVLSGTPTESGVFPFTVQVEDDAATTVSRPFTLPIAAAPTVLTILPITFPAGRVNDPYPTRTLQAVGGTPPYTWAVSSGALPPPLALNTSTGTIPSATPTTAADYTFTFRVTDSVAATAFLGSFSVTIEDAIITPPADLQITTTVLRRAQIGVAYSDTIVAENGTAPYTFSITSGNTPSWMTLNASSGAITGTPTGGDVNVDLIFKVVDAVAAEDTQPITLRVTTAAAAPDDYADFWAAQSSFVAGHFFRSQAEIDASMQKSPSVFWKYDATQNCAKLFHPRRLLNADYPDIFAAHLADNGHPLLGNEGVVAARSPRITVAKNTGTLLFLWDVWWGEEFFTNNGNVDAFKLFFLKLAHAGSPDGGSKDYSIIHHRLRGLAPATLVNTPATVATVFGDSDGGPGGMGLPTGVTSRDPFSPTGVVDFRLPHMRVVKSNTWTRYILEVKLNVDPAFFTEWNAFVPTTLAAITTTAAHKPPGQPETPAGTTIPYDMWSLWMANESDITFTRVYYRVPFTHHPAYPYIGQFNLVWDTSDENWFREAQRFDLGTLAAGQSFTLTVPAFTIPAELARNPANESFASATTSVITFTGLTGLKPNGAVINPFQVLATTMSEALTALPSVFKATVGSLDDASHLYSVQFFGAGTSGSYGFDYPLITIQPTGFTPGSVIETQKGGIGLNVGLTGPLVAYLRGVQCHHFATHAAGDLVIDEANPDLFEIPVGV